MPSKEHEHMEWEPTENEVINSLQQIRQNIYLPHNSHNQELSYRELWQVIHLNSFPQNFVFFKIFISAIQTVGNHQMRSVQFA